MEMTSAVTPASRRGTERFSMKVVSPPRSGNLGVTKMTRLQWLGQRGILLDRFPPRGRSSQRSGIAYSVESPKLHHVRERWRSSPDLLKGSRGHKPAVLQEAQLINVADGGQAVGHEDRGDGPAEALEGLGDPVFGLVIQS